MLDRLRARFARARIQRQLPNCIDDLAARCMYFESILSLKAEVPYLKRIEMFVAPALAYVIHKYPDFYEVGDAFMFGTVKLGLLKGSQYPAMEIELAMREISKKTITYYLEGTAFNG